MITILDRSIKANFEIRIYNKKSGKTSVISIYTENETEDSLKKKIKENLK